KLALPNRPVVALVGDGSSMYTNQALWTAARESLAVVYVIFNNTSYRILKERTKALKGFSAEDDHYVAMDLDRPQIAFAGLARSLGVPGTPVSTTSDIGPAGRRAGGARHAGGDDLGRRAGGGPGPRQRRSASRRRPDRPFVRIGGRG